MDAFDMNKISTAITYMDRIAEGRNPVNNCQPYFLIHKYWCNKQNA